MTNKLGVYWSVMHRRASDYDYFKRLNPSAIKLMDAGQPDYAWVRANLPGALVLARDWALSEQHGDMLADPTGTGKRHAQEWAAKQAQLGFDPGRTLVLGINEPHVWEAGVAAALTAYTVAFLDECARLGLRGGALQLGVGWPANVGPDMPPNWNPYAPVADAIRRGNHALVTHEYWADSGPGELWGWWAGRSLKCPWDVPIIIGECGVDMYVKTPSIEHNRRGWQGHMDATRYARELAEYVGRMSTDRRFVGCCVFASDFQNREWASFDLEPAYSAVLSTPIPMQPPPVPIKPSTVYVPVAPKQEEPMSSNWERCIAWVLRWEGGFQANPADVGNYYNGQLVGTKYGISAASWGHLYDIPNLTIEQAKDIYFVHYWQASGADKLTWPLCLLQMDTAILHGTGTARSWLAETGPNAYAYAAKRLRVYLGMKTWNEFGAAWTRRTADLLDEIGKA